MSGWQAAFLVLLTALASVAVGVLIGVHLERAGKEIADAIRGRKENE